MDIASSLCHIGGVRNIGLVWGPKWTTIHILTSKSMERPPSSVVGVTYSIPSTQNYLVNTITAPIISVSVLTFFKPDYDLGGGLIFTLTLSTSSFLDIFPLGRRPLCISTYESAICLALIRSKMQSQKTSSEQKMSNRFKPSFQLRVCPVGWI